MSEGDRKDGRRPSSSGTIGWLVPTSSKTPQSCSCAGVTRVVSHRRSWIRSRVQPASIRTRRCSQPRTTMPWPALAVENVAGLHIAAAKVRRIPSGSPFRWLATWWGPSVGISVTVVSSGW